MTTIIAKSLCLIYVLWVVVSLVWDLKESKSGSDFTYFLCRPLRLFSTPIFTGVIVWIVAIVAAVYAFNYGITLF